jgi:hypothetical protein
MPSQFITPPDHLPSKQNILIVNALESELATLVLWLKTVSDEYNIHLFHNEMPETDWAVAVAEQAEHIVIAKIDEDRMHDSLKEVIKDRAECVSRFGADTDYADLIQFFLTNKQLMV